MAKKEKAEPGFQEAFDELEAILEKIESSEVDVDQLADAVKRARELYLLCKGKIEKAEVEVKKVVAELEKETTDSGDDDKEDEDAGTAKDEEEEGEAPPF